MRVERLSHEHCDARLPPAQLFIEGFNPFSFAPLLINGAVSSIIARHQRPISCTDFRP